MTTPYIDPNIIFASQAPDQDKPDTLQAMGKYLAN
jgi:hypothetical protein